MRKVSENLGEEIATLFNTIVVSNWMMNEEPTTYNIWLYAKLEAIDKLADIGIPVRGHEHCDRVMVRAMADREVKERRAGA